MTTIVAMIVCYVCFARVRYILYSLITLSYIYLLHFTCVLVLRLLILKLALQCFIILPYLMTQGAARL